MERYENIYDVVETASKFFKKKNYSSQSVAEEYISKILSLAENTPNFPSHYIRNLKSHLKGLKSYKGEVYRDHWGRITNDLYEIGTNKNISI